jgi:hypothetical protein
MKRTILWLIAALIVTVSCQPAPTPTSLPPTVEPPTTTPVPPSPTPTPTSPPLTGIATVIKSFFDARNAKNIDAAMAFFADDAVYTNHFGAKYVGKTEIRPLVQHDADVGTQFELSNIQATESKVTYHLRFLVGGNPTSEYDFDALVQGDKITSVTSH